VPHSGFGEQALQQIECCGVEPLQIVEKQRERVLGPRERAEELSEHHAGSASAHPAAEARYGRLFPDHDSTSGTDTISWPFGPTPPSGRAASGRHLRSLSGEDLTDERLECLRQVV